MLDGLVSTMYIYWRLFQCSIIGLYLIQHHVLKLRIQFWQSPKVESELALEKAKEVKNVSVLQEPFFLQLWNPPFPNLGSCWREGNSAVCKHSFNKLSLSYWMVSSALLRILSQCPMCVLFSSSHQNVILFIYIFQWRE